MFASKFSISLWIFGFSPCHVLNVLVMNFAAMPRIADQPTSASIVYHNDNLTLSGTAGIATY